MQELLEFILQHIVKHPDSIDIQKEESEEGNVVTFTAKIHPEDIALVIGKGGKTVKSIRNLLNVIALQEKKRILLNVKEAEEKD